MTAPSLYDLISDRYPALGPMPIVLRGDGRRWLESFTEYPDLWDQMRGQFPPDAWEYR